MDRILKLLLVVSAMSIISCSSNSELENHLLNGNYLGNWHAITDVEAKLSIEFDEKKDGLVLFFSLADSLDLNIISDTEFSIDRYESNGYSNEISGILVEDTLYMENEVFLVSDEMNTKNTRKGTFVKQ